MSQLILLVEPKANTSYPPMGLMKLATYHRLKGDTVKYVSGIDKSEEIKETLWNKIYITSIFTYNYNSLVQAIRYYCKLGHEDTEICVGGIAATLLAEKVKLDTKITPHMGLQDDEDPFLRKLSESDSNFEYLQHCTPSIDNLFLDYTIFPEDSRYNKFLEKNYFLFSTKGCSNKCGFCAVKTLEPKFVDYIPIMPRIENVIRTTGYERPNLLLLDNNVAASDQYFRIIDEIKDCGFRKGEKLCHVKNGRKIYRKRSVDFNQGVDLRLMTSKKMQKMGEISISPLRLAFDSVDLEDLYEEKAQLAIDSGITHLSNYMLYNYNDTPDDLYKRFQVNLRILERNEGAKIFSFPMRYSPIERTDRKYIGKHWTKRQIRAVQLVLQATHGIVSHKLPFFSRAFGQDLTLFNEVLFYPYHYIINRNVVEYESSLLEKWTQDYRKLTASEALEFKRLISAGPMKELPTTTNGKINRLLQHYEGETAQVLNKDAFANLIERFSA